MPNPKGVIPWRAIAGRKRRAADRHDAQAEELRREAAELEAVADEAAKATA